MTGRRLEEPAAATDTLNAARRRRYEALSRRLSLPGHPSTSSRQRTVRWFVAALLLDEPERSSRTIL